VASGEDVSTTGRGRARLPRDVGVRTVLLPAGVVSSASAPLRPRLPLDVGGRPVLLPVGVEASAPLRPRLPLDVGGRPVFLPAGLVSSASAAESGSSVPPAVIVGASNASGWGVLVAALVAAFVRFPAFGFWLGPGDSGGGVLVDVSFCASLVSGGSSAPLNRRSADSVPDAGGWSHLWSILSAFSECEKVFPLACRQSAFTAPCRKC
jgi:hypothetical protein